MISKFRNLIQPKNVTSGIGLLIIIVAGVYLYKSPPRPIEIKDPYTIWSMEVFDKIQSTYWNKVADIDLSNLYVAALEKVTEKPVTLTDKNRAGVQAVIEKSLANQDGMGKKKIVTNLAAVVLYNLPPAGRNALYTSRDETALRNEVKNVDPGKDLYASFGLAKGASTAEIEKSYETETAKLKTVGTPEAKQKIEELSYAKQVLTTPDSKANYDAAKIEPTVFAKTLSPEVCYIYISKFSPTTFDELVKAANDTDRKNGLKALVIDIRGNIGGAVDILPYFLGLFIGQGQYAYDFFHQEIYDPNKTKLAKLPSLNKFKNLALLTDNGTQSSAEIMTATFKKYNVGVVVGKTTKGWGTIENTFPIETVIDPVERYSLFLVHRITLRDDGQPIEGRGVDPDVDITKSDWRQTLADYVSYQPLFEAIKSVATKPPIK